MGLEIANIGSYTKYAGATRPRTPVEKELQKFYNGDKAQLDSFVKSFTKPKAEIPSYLLDDNAVKAIIKGGQVNKYVGGAKPIRNLSKINWENLFTQAMKFVKTIK